METIIKEKTHPGSKNTKIVLLLDDKNGYYIRYDRLNLSSIYITINGSHIIKFWKTIKGAEKRFNSMG